MDGKVLSNPSNVFCYFTRLIDGESHRLTAVRRATAFKGVLKSRLLQFTTDALKIVEDKVFKLDSDFDLLIDDTGVSIFRPSGFEFVGDLQEAILAAAPANVKLIQTDLPFVDFTPIQTYALSILGPLVTSHPYVCKRKHWALTRAISRSYACVLA